MVRIRIDGQETQLTWDEWEERVREGRLPPTVEVCIDSITGDAFVPAGDLEAYHSLRGGERAAFRQRFREGPPPVMTAILVGLQIRVWWVGKLPEVQERFADLLLNSTPGVLENGQVWRLLGMGFYHQELTHLVGNLVFLAYCGFNVERALGWRNLAVVYLVSVLFGALLSAFGGPVYPSLGASGGVFGLVAATTVFGLYRTELLPARALRVFGWAMLPYLVVFFLMGLWGEGVDNLAHLGGLLAGGTIAVLLDPEPLQRRPGWNTRWRLGLLGGSALVMTAIAALGTRIEPLVPLQVAEAPRVFGSAERVAAARDRLAARPLQYEVPAGWGRGATVGGAAAWMSPVGPRAWSVRTVRLDRPLDDDALVSRWRERVATRVDHLEIHAEAGPEVAGRATLHVTVSGAASLGDPHGRAVTQAVLAEAWFTQRGTELLEVEWQTEAAMASRLAPLRDRLLATVRWDPPVALTAAREAYARTPDGVGTRVRLAAELLEIGEADEAASLATAVLHETPRSAEARSLLLKISRLYPASVGAPESLWDETLRLDPPASLLDDLVDALVAAGRTTAADGALELAWARAPTSRGLRRTRRRAGLPVMLTADGLPAHLAVDAITGAPTLERLDALRATPWSLEAAEAAGQAYGADREAVVDAAITALRDGAAVEDLLLALELGGVPADEAERARALERISSAVEAARAGTPVRWIPERLAAALRAT